jgi:hypothetical protein
MRTSLFILLLLPISLFAQDRVVKSVMLDSVMISAVKAGFSVEEFIHYVKTDTTFYQGFKNLRYYPHQYENTLEVYKANESVAGNLYRSGSYQRDADWLYVAVDSLYSNGKIFNRKGEYKHYTPEFFDHVFFPEDTIKVSKYASDDEDEAESENDKNEEDAKVIVFNPGSIEVEKSGSNKEKLAIFDIDMQQYYDYLISQTYYADSIDCYQFSCKMKPSLSEKDQEEVLIRELTSYFDKKTFKVLYRKYVLSYRHWLVDLDVSIEVQMGYAGEELVPTYIHYHGFWDVPFNKAERADFKLWNSHYQLID